MTTRDFRGVYAGLKDFQLATVDHVVRRFFEDDEPTDRFLVADEVGLGKTLVARGVIARTIEHHLERDTRRIDIVYICSNGDIARQNINRLNVLERDDIQLASRITLLPRILHQLESNRINFVSFTPGTSFNLRSSEGVVNERVLLYHLLRDIWPEAMHGAGPRKALSGGANFERFRGYLTRMSRRDLDDTMAAGFRAALEREEGRLAAAGEPTYRRQLDELVDALRWVRRNRAKVLGEDLWRQRSRFVGGLREILAQVCVDALEPDLVILDEFQRFKHIMEGDRPEAQLADRLFRYAAGEHRVKVLLLSATPYKMYTLTEDVDEDHYADFVKTMRFLLPSEADVIELSHDLRDYRQALWRVGEDRGEAAQGARHRIEQRLRDVMCRTERLAVKSDRNGMLAELPVEGVRLDGDDVRRFLALERVSEEIDGYGMLPFWLSAAYPLNFMEHYKLDTQLEDAITQGPTGRLRQLLGEDGLLLRWRDVERYREIDPANARLRGFLGETIGKGMWRLLWMPPALPYYALGEPFNQPELAHATKRLVFSSWAVVPKVIAAMTTYEAERRMVTALDGAARNTAEARARIRPLLRFQMSQGRPTGMTGLALLYPSSVLAEVGDPLKRAARLGAVDSPVPRDVLLREVADELRGRLARHLDGAPGDGATDARWYWAAPFLLDRDDDPGRYLEWLDPRTVADRVVYEDDEESGDEPAARGLVDHYLEVRQLLAGEREPLGRPPDDLLPTLAELAVAGPGVVALRALQRIGLTGVLANDWHPRDYAGYVAWGLRSLFNEPEVQHLLRSGAGGGHREDAYWRLVLRYCLDGCLQAVMDEYVHTLVESLGVADLHGELRFDPIAEAVREVLTMRTVNYGVRNLEVANGGVRMEKVRMRGHFGVRFGDDRSEDDQSLARSSTVRKAFNSPFRPFVLATTSVGQEGLDFHTYCHAVTHWNLPGNPVDMEQREGRVHRYKGHAVRKNVAATHRAAAFRGGGDPWEEMFADAATTRGEDDNELVPYWVYPVDGGARIERYVPALPLSRDARQLERLRRSMAAYRLVFGQPRQEDLVAFLSDRLDQSELEGLLDELRIDLTPAPLPAGRREELTTVPRIAVPISEDAELEAGRDLSDAGMTPRQARYQRFWGQVLDEVKRRYPGWTRATGPKESWVALPAGISDIAYTMLFVGGDRLRIELYVDPTDDRLQAVAWPHFLARRGAIEERFGAPLSWEDMPGARASRIAWYYDQGPASIDREHDWDRYREWLVDKLGPLREAVQPAVDALRVERYGEAPATVWDRDRFLEHLRQNLGSAVAERVEQLMDAFPEAKSRWGTGTTHGTWQPRWQRPSGKIWPMTFRSSGQVELPFTSIQRRPPFTDPALLDEYRRRLNNISPFVQVDEEDVNRWPTFPLAVLESDEAFERLLDVLRWFRDTAVG